jgi:hypothetical protein
VVDFDAPFGQQLFDVAVRLSVLQVPADRNHDHIRRETELSETRPRWWHSDRATKHRLSLPQPVIRHCNSAVSATAGVGATLYVSLNTVWNGCALIGTVHGRGRTGEGMVMDHAVATALLSMEGRAGGVR